MKQLTKLGSQGARVLTDDQMKNVHGGAALGCTPGKPGMLCIPGLCETLDGYGNLVTGTCTTACRCEINVGVLPSLP